MNVIALTVQQALPLRSGLVPTERIGKTIASPRFPNGSCKLTASYMQKRKRLVEAKSARGILARVVSIADTAAGQWGATCAAEPTICRRSSAAF